MTFTLPSVRRVAFLAAITVLFSIQAEAQAPVYQKAEYFDVSPALRDIPVKKSAFWKKWTAEVENEIPNKLHFKKVIRPDLMGQPDGALQQFRETDNMEALVVPSVNFDGLDNSDNTEGRFTPPDPAGDVGPNNYVQAVNCMLQVFSKSGASLYGPVTTSTLWNGFTGNWTGHNDGDAVVMYDELADRWIISQFAVDCGTYPNYTEYELVAVSQTSDPTGAYYRYAFKFDYMPDYPKMGVWRDGYYISANRFNTNNSASPFIGAAMGVFERDKMLAGDPNAQFIYFKAETLGGTSGNANYGPDCGSMLPGDCDGTFAPAGTPNYFSYINDDAWGGSDELRIWQLKPDWTTPASSTCTFVNAIPVASFSTFSSYVIAQKGVSLTLDDLSDRLMHRLQYRNMGSYESMVTCHTVNSGSNIAGVRWYEMRKSGSSWTMYQQGTYAPGDSKSRWMGSAAMNAQGDIAIGYTVSGTSAYPSIYFTGRKSGDALGTLSVTESPIVDGAKSMTGADRWGDYAMMSVDPSDNKTFWHTNMYVGTYGGSYPWSTRIAAFAFNNAPQVKTLAATAITATGATLNGTVNPNTLATNYAFEWGTTTSYGSTTASTSAGSGSSDVAVNATLSGLTVGNTYHFRITATNSDGTTSGDDMSFIAGQASVTTAAVSTIAATTATGGGSVLNDGGSTATRGICWSTTANPTVADSKTTDGTGTGDFTSSITGLTPNTAYHVRAYVTNAAGTAYGSDVTFTTTSIAAPVATAATAVTGTGFTANWNAVSGADAYALDVSLYSTFSEAGGSATLTEGFSGGTTAPAGWTFTGIGATYTTTGNYGAASPSLKLDGTGDAVETPTLASAATELKFWYKGQSTNTSSSLLIEGYDGSAWSTVDVIKPLNTSATTVTYNTSSTVKLPASLVKFRFSYSKSTGNLAFDDVNITYGGTTPSFVSGYENLSVTATSQSVTGLSNNTTYYYRVRAKNGTNASANSNVITVTTSTGGVTTPTLTTATPTSVAQTSATGGGNITADGGAAVTARGVCWSTSANPTTADSKTTDGTGTGSFASSITGLTASTLYHVRAYATNSAGTAYGNDVTFTTSSAAFTAPVATAATNVTSSGFTANWNAVTGADSYALDVSLYNTFSTGGGSTTLTEAFDGGLTAPAGWTFTGIDATYTSAGNYGTASPSIRFDATGDAVETPTLSGTATEFKFWHKGNSTDATSSLLVEGYNGSAWVTVANVNPLPATGVTLTYNASSAVVLPSNLVKFRFTYTKSVGNLALDDVSITYGGTTSSFVAGYENLTVTGTSQPVTGLTNNTTYYYRVRAKNSTATTDNSNVINVTTTSPGGVTTPSLTTSTPTSVTQTSATGGGNITADGGAAVTVRGVCWSTSANPTVADTKTSDGAGTGSFSSSITGLTAGTLYHVRAYATNSVGTAYGNDLTFTTASATALATLITNTPSSITQTTALSGGSISSDGGTAITARGVCWSTSANPTIADTKTADGAGAGSFASSITGLTANTLYHVRAYATNSVGTAYGNDLTFTTAGTAALATLTTTTPSSVTQTTATSGGNISADGGAAVTARGVCWSTTTNPSTSDSKTSNGSGTGSFTSSITGLLPGTQYHVRAYATNSVGTAYGNDVTFTTSALAAPVATAASLVSSNGFRANWNASPGAAGYRLTVAYDNAFTNIVTGYSSLDVNDVLSYLVTGLTASTPYYYRVVAYYGASVSGASNVIAVTTSASTIVLPTLTTTALSSVTFTTATSGGNITLDGGAAITARGICWNTVAEPTIANSHTADGAGTGSFTSQLTGLTPGTAYHVRAYATNIAGTAYGNDVLLSPAVLQAPVATDATQVSAYGFTANWNAVPEASGYSLDVASDNAFSNLLAGYNNLEVNGSLSSALTGLTPNTPYFYRVRSYYLGLTSVNSNTISVSTLVNTGVDPGQTAVAEAYSFKKTIFVNLRDNTKGNIYIFSIDGKLLRTVPAVEGLSKITVFAPGVYVVKVLTSKVNLVKDVVIE